MPNSTDPGDILGVIISRTNNGRGLAIDFGVRASRMPAYPQAVTAANKWPKVVTMRTWIDNVNIHSEFVTVG